MPFAKPQTKQEVKLILKYLQGLFTILVTWILMAILLIALSPVFRWLEKTSISEDSLMSVYFGIVGCAGVFAGTITTPFENRKVSAWLFAAFSLFIYLGFFVQPLINRGRGFMIDPIDVGFALGCFICAFAFVINGHLARHSRNA